MFNKLIPSLEDLMNDLVLKELIYKSFLV